MANDILLEAGTNEMELLVFRLGSTPFGINVAKVREIVQRQQTIRIPYAPSAVEGSFRLRERVLTLVNLGRHFGMEGEATQDGAGMIIVVEFNNLTCGILVDAVERIYRLRWDQIESPSQYLVGMSVPVTGVAKVDGEIVQIADFETIVAEILGIQSAAELPGEISEDIDTRKARLVLADDSSVLRTNLLRILTKAGFQSLTICNDGQEAWELLGSRKTDPDGPCDLVLTDVEMPRMDGFHLTSRIKKDPDLQHIPVILFSSLISEDNRKKGESVGADAQVSKPDSQALIDAIESCLCRQAVVA